MPLPDLLAELERDAAARAQAILSDARQRSATGVEAARRDVAQRLSAALGRREAELAAAIAASLAAARHDARRRTLTARATYLDRVREAARRRLRGAQADDDVVASLSGLLAETLTYVGHEAIEIRAAPCLTSALRRLVGTDPARTVVDDPTIDAGFVARTRDGRLTVDQTLTARLDRDWPAVAIALASRRQGVGR